MRKYLSFFRIRFINGLQYRAAALAGIATQFAWGFMEILVYRAFFRYNPASFPMELEQLTSYLWLRQAMLGLFMSWYFDNSLFDMIRDGGVACELCRPADIYSMWYVKNLATRASRAALRCFPILLVAVFLPDGFKLYPPAGITAFLLFLLSAVCGFALTVSFSMLIYASAFYTVSAQGIRIVAVNVTELLSGALIPIPFFPEAFQRVCYFLPFASMESTPFLIYSGSLSGGNAYAAFALQLFWLAFTVALGRLLFYRAERRIIIQGG